MTKNINLLQDTAAFLVATSDAAVGQDLRDKMAVITNNWEELFQYVEKYMHGGDVTRWVKNCSLKLVFFTLNFVINSKLPLRAQNYKILY